MEAAAPPQKKTRTHGKCASAGARITKPNKGPVRNRGPSSNTEKHLKTLLEKPSGAEKQMQTLMEKNKDLRQMRATHKDTEQVRGSNKDHKARTLAIFPSPIRSSPPPLCFCSNRPYCSPPPPNPLLLNPHPPPARTIALPPPPQTNSPTPTQ